MLALTRNLAGGRSSVITLSRAADAWSGYRRWLRSIGREPTHELLREYEDACARALRALDPPRKPGKSPVRTLVEVARRLQRPRRPRPDRTIASLDAVVTIGRSRVGRRLDRRAVREVAAMLGGRVLFHRVGRRWLSLRAQSEHTLSGWTILRLARSRRIRSYRVRPCPEFWRPEQRRPGAVLVFPIGGGVACIARRRRFESREREAVRTVLRFLSARLSARGSDVPSDAALLPAATQPSAAPPPSAAVARAPRVHGDLVGESAPWLRVLRQIDVFAESNATVVLVGETGTGKEGVARALHAASRRGPHAFVAVNCGALAPSILASELFGHIRGAFTGADRTREGLFVRAHRGTLFLDEVADMPAEMQVALLRVLEEREVRPVGAVHAVPVDVRIVAAAARDLAAEVPAGRFREDLYHRLNVVRIELPPLRARRDDIGLLAAHLAARHSPPVTIHPDAFPVLLDHDWPGNVRELENVIRASAAMSDGAELTPEIVRGVLAQRRLLRQRAAGSTVPRESRLLDLVGPDWVSAPELAARLGVSVRTVNRSLCDLVTRGVVVAAGEARSRRYARAR